MKHYGIMGYYGIANFGDDLMLYLLIEELVRRQPAARFSIFMARSGNANRVVLPQVSQVAVLPRTNLRMLALRLRKVDVLAFGGGTCMHERGFCNIKLTTIARLLGRPVVWLGIGVEPIRSVRSVLKARYALRICSGVAVRDSDSYTNIKTLRPGIERLELTADLAYLLPGSRMAPPSDGDPSGAMVVSWRTLRGVVDSDLQEVYVAGLARAVREFATVAKVSRIVILNLADVDTEVNQTLADLLDSDLPRDGLRVEYVRESTLQEKLALIRSASFCFSARLHGFLVAKLLGVPSVGLAYAPKVRRFAEELTGGNVVNLEDFSHDAASVVAALWREKDNPAMVPDLAERQAAALRNVDMLQEAVAWP
jgi:polysaccharide pyruvyl transferase WcaK-like protein